MFHCTYVCITCNCILCRIEYNAFICNYTYKDVQQNKIISLHIPAYLEVGVAVQGQQYYITLGAKKLRVLLKDPIVTL